MKPVSKTVALIILVAAAAGVSAPAHAQGITVGIDIGGGSGSDDTDRDIDIPDVVDAIVSGVDSSLPSQEATLDQETALQAVQSARALPLADILVIAKDYTDGEVIDAQLISVRNFLLYELKVLDADGAVSTLYFYARSGRIVQAR